MREASLAALPRACTAHDSTQIPKLLELLHQFAARPRARSNRAKLAKAALEEAALGALLGELERALV